MAKESKYFFSGPYFKVALRNIQKHKGFATINIVGLAVGMACSICITVYVRHELSFDKHHEKAPQIYRACAQFGPGGEQSSAWTSPPMARAMLEDFPEIENVIRFDPWPSNDLVRYGDKSFLEKRIKYADDGIFDVFTAPDGAFHRVSRFHDGTICDLFTHEVFSLLFRKKLIGLPLAQKKLRWRHTGFNVHSQARAQTKKEVERVGKYMIRSLLSLKQLFFDESKGKVRYQYDKHGSQEELMDYLEFIARVNSHIPDKSQVMVRYYGLCKALHKPYYAEFGREKIDVTS